MAKNPSEADHITYVQVWQGIVVAMQGVEDLAEGGATAGPERLLDLRQQARTLLGHLAKDLSAALGPSNAQEVLLPLVFACDEQVLRRLPRSVQKTWPLLQAELFGITDGGEKFFQLVDEKLLQVQPMPLLLEVLLYCLGRGFLGRYVNEPAKLLPYKDRLKERLHLHPRPAGLASQHRQAERRVSGVKDPVDADGHRPLIAPLVLYVATFVLILAVPFGIVLVSNLPFSQTVSAPLPSEPEPAAEEPSTTSSAEPGLHSVIPSTAHSPAETMAHSDASDAAPASSHKHKRRHRSHRHQTLSES